MIEIKTKNDVVLLSLALRAVRLGQRIEVCEEQKRAAEDLQMRLDRELLVYLRAEKGIKK